MFKLKNCKATYSQELCEDVTVLVGLAHGVGKANAPGDEAI